MTVKYILQSYIPRLIWKASFQAGLKFHLKKVMVFFLKNEMIVTAPVQKRKEMECTQSATYFLGRGNLAI